MTEYGLESQIYFVAQTACTASLTTKLYHLHKLEEAPIFPIMKKGKEKKNPTNKTHTHKNPNHNDNKKTAKKQ